VRTFAVVPFLCGRFAWISPALCCTVKQCLQRASC